MIDRKKILATLAGLFYLCSLFFSINAHSQNSSFHFNQIDQTSGLSELTNSDLFKDSRGFLWVSSYDGLNRFDGKTTKIYRPVSEQGKEEPNITGHIFEDENGNIWFTTNTGIHRIDWPTDSIVSIPVSLPNKTAGSKFYRAFHFDKNSNLWYLANGHVYTYHTEKEENNLIVEWKVQNCKAIENKNGLVIGLAGPHNGRPGGLEILLFDSDKNPVHSKFFTANDPNNFPTALIVDFHIENDSIFWLPSNIGLIKLNIHSHEYVINVPDGFSNSPNFVAISPWKKNFFWLASSSDGLFQFDINDKAFIRQDTLAITHSQINKINRINDILIDLEDNLWLSIWEKGLLCTNLAKYRFKHLMGEETYSPFKKRAVSAIVQDSENNIWCSVPEEGIYIFDKNLSLIEYSNPFKNQFNSAYGSRPQHLFCDNKGNIWTSSESGLIIWKKEKKQFFPISKDPIYITDFVQISDNYFLAATIPGMVTIEKKKETGKYIINGLKIPHQGVYKTFWDKKNLLYIFDGFDQLTVYAISKNLSVEQVKIVANTGFVNGIFPDREEPILWLASSKGLASLNTENFDLQFITDQEKILDRALNHLLDDDEGHLWLSSNTGIFKYSPHSGKAKQYSMADGLQALQFMIGSGCKLKDGSLCFGGVNGLNIIDPSKIKDHQTLPSVHITDITINDNMPLEDVNPVYLAEKKFPFSNNTLSFDFVAIEYSAPRENQYKYFMEGFDKDTVLAGNTGFARYANLPSGKYTLNIWGSNSDHVWNPEARQFKISILPPWYETWWFRSIAVLAVMAAMYVFYNFRVRQIRRKADYERKEASFRQKEAEYKQLVAETETAVLRLQMNPHFIFNSMNSISSYIMQKDIDTANDYLTRFSKLMRMILNFSEKPFVSVSQEMELLELYLQTETMRFEKKIDYKFHTSPSFDPDEYILPTMIMQPFVENAIWHGLSSKKGKGRVDVRFEETGQQLVCTVEDNGVGRKKAGSTKALTEPHSSKAISITERRLALLQKNTGQPTSLTITDLHDSQLQATGTKVVLQLPIL